MLPSNTSGSVTIPLNTTPTILASLSIHSDRDNDIVLLTATVGWLAVTNGTGLDRVNVLFKFWRNAVGGTLIFSADDSSEADAANRKVTSFEHVDIGFEAGRVTYFLTAELPDPGSTATVIAPITFTATGIRE